MNRSVWQIDPTHLTPYYNLTLCSALAQAGWNVHYASSVFIYDSALSYSNDFQTHFFYFPQIYTAKLACHPFMRRILRIYFYPFGHRRVLQSVIANPPTLVHLQWTRLPRLDLYLVNQLHRHGIPVIYTAHDVEPLFPYAFDLSAIYTAVDAIVVHTEANQNKLLQHHPSLSEKKIHVIPHIAPTWPLPSGANRSAARLWLGLAPNVPVLLFFGSNRPYKGFDVLMDAFAYVRKIFPDLWLVIAGRFDDSQYLSFRQSQVLIEPNYVPADRVWTYHLAADVVVLPYRKISQSGELITAMSFGIPVIVTGVGGLAETVNGTGWVVSPDDPIALAEAILDAFSNNSRLESMSKLSSHIIREYHSPDVVAQQTVKLYSEFF